MSEFQSDYDRCCLAIATAELAMYKARKAGNWRRYAQARRHWLALLRVVETYPEAHTLPEPPQLELLDAEVGRHHDVGA